MELRSLAMTDLFHVWKKDWDKCSSHGCILFLNLAISEEDDPELIYGEIMLLLA